MTVAALHYSSLLLSCRRFSVEEIPQRRCSDRSKANVVKVLERHEISTRQNFKMRRVASCVVPVPSGHFTPENETNRHVLVGGSPMVKQ